jgi:hypothetical protein
MKIQIDIDDYQIDNAFQENLKWHIDNAKQCLAELKKKKKLEKFQMKEKERFEELLPALKIVGEYFGVK